MGVASDGTRAKHKTAEGRVYCMRILSYDSGFNILAITLLVSLLKAVAIPMM